MRQLVREINPVAKIYWDGWHSDTLSLQRAGWEFAFDQDPRTMSMQVLIRNPRLEIYGYSKSQRYDYERYLDQRVVPELQIQAMVCQLQSVATDINFDAFQPVDATPEFIETSIQDISDYQIFQPTKAREIIVEPQDVRECLRLILEKQSPKQREIREKKAKERYRFHAKLLSFAA